MGQIETENRPLVGYSILFLGILFGFSSVFAGSST
ncbi:unnamed protein product, partial [marine sediment metagenome]